MAADPAGLAVGREPHRQAGGPVASYSS